MTRDTRLAGVPRVPKPTTTSTRVLVTSSEQSQG